MAPTRERERRHDHERDPGPADLETAHDHVSLYVLEAESHELLEAIHDADTVVIPDVGDRVSVASAAVEGTLSDRSIDYRETGHSPTYVVERREITYLHVDFDVEDIQQNETLVSEVRVWVREVDEHDR